MGQAKVPTDSNVREEVMKKYHSGVGPKALAEEFDISINTIKSWISRDKGNAPKNAKKGASSKGKKGAPAKKKSGGQPNNKNAVGHAPSVPLRNTNAVKHGAYRNPYLELLSDKEKALMLSVSDDEETLVMEQIQILTVREFRIMEVINRYKTGDETVLTSVTTTEIGKQVVDGDNVERELDDVKVETKTENKDAMIARLERELSTVQNSKTKNVQILSQIRAGKEQRIRDAELHPLRMEMLDAQIEQIDANTQRLLGENIELEDTTAADDLIYGGGKDEGETPNPENIET